MPTVKPLAVLRSVSGAGTSDGTTGHIPQMKSDKLYCDKPFQIGRAREPHHKNIETDQDFFVPIPSFIADIADTYGDRGYTP